VSTPEEKPPYISWSNGIVMRTDRADGLRLFCFPHAGVGASIFSRWNAELPSAIEVCPIQLPGRGGRWSEPPFTRLGPLIEALSEALSPLLETRFAFFGHSMGALVALELARHLRREKRRGPVRLIASAARAPQIPDPDPPLHDVTDGELVKGLEHLDGIPREISQNLELLHTFLPALRADLAVCETYAYYDEPPLDCPISAYGGQQDTRVPHEHLEGWRAQTVAGFVLRMFPGNHFFFMSRARAPFLHALCADLAGWEGQGGSAVGGGT
jgi:medium-chain acyl-[acyl-carrier-protein] hydrolase